MWDILRLPLAACLVLTVIHCYLGIHVLMREVIFVDLALAQIAAMGVAVGTLFGYQPGTPEAYACALGFTFVGAGVFSFTRFRDRRVPQEAMIGITYAVASALAILVLSKSAVEREEIEHMLTGRLLFVDAEKIVHTAMIYASVGLVHFVLRKKFFAISRSGHEAVALGMRVRLWDFIFYMTFGLVVTSSVQIAGVLLVFSYLVAPAVCAMIFFNSIMARLLGGWAIGMLGTAIGLVASAWWDVEPAVAIVTILGVLVVVASGVHAVRESLVRRTAWPAPLNEKIN